MNLEASEPDWYEDGHVKHARRVARELGWIFYEANRRQDLSNRVDAFVGDVDRLNRIFSSSPVVKRARAKFIVYKIDYINGEFIAYSPELSGGKRFTHDFVNRSLPRELMEKRRAIEIHDVQEELRKDEPILDPRGVKEFDIQGCVIAYPVRALGSIACIVVTWGDSRRQLLPVALKRICLIAQLFANDPSDGCELSIGWWRYIDERLSQFDSDVLKGPEALLESGRTNEFVMAFLESLTRPGCNLKRLRLWLRVDPGPNRFRVVAAVGGETSRYVGVYTDRRDPYTRYTCRRYLTSGSAIRQHKSMFSVPDQNCTKLDKDPDGSWLVAPIVSDDSLIGWVSADNHELDTERGEPVDRPVEEEIGRFQAHYLDLVVDVFDNLSNALEGHYSKVKAASIE